MMQPFARRTVVHMATGFVLAMVSLRGRADPAQLWPLPEGEVLHGGRTLRLDAATFNFSHSLPAGGTAAETLDSNFKLYRKWIFSCTPQAPYENNVQLESDMLLQGLDVTVDDPSAQLQLGMDESYKLVVGSPRAHLRAASVYGAIRGLETFSQLLDMNSCPEYRIHNATLTVVDSPRYPWRGLMMDLARHFFTLEQLRAIVDQMAQNKLVRSPIASARH